MIADEGHPPLSWSFWTFWILGHIPTNRTRRNPNPDLQQQFIGDPFLSPRRIVRCHFDDQPSDIGGDPGPAARPRLPLPEQSESLAAPSNQRIRFDDCQGVAPFEMSGKVRECKTNRIGSPSRFLVPLDVQHELFAEKQILGGQCRGRSECEAEEDQSINEHMRSAVQEPIQSGETRHSRQNRTICKALDSRPTIEAISDFIFADDGPNAAETSHLASPGRQERRQRYRREAGGTGPPRRETVLAG